MRKLMIAALFVLALGCFAGASIAYAGDCCKPKCKYDLCKDDCCKPKCSPCKPKCNPCKPKCDPCKPVCKPKCKPCCEGKWVGDYNACCPPRAPQACYTVDPCTVGAYKHPYEACWAGDGMLCDTGCCGTYLPCKTKCMTCETICKCVEVCDPCNPCKSKAKYVYETVCHEIERPTVIPWWFNERGAGNVYIEEGAEE